MLNDYQQLVQSLDRDVAVGRLTMAERNAIIREELGLPPLPMTTEQATESSEANRTGGAIRADRSRYAFER
jgi:hypothetical protein